MKSVLRSLRHPYLRNASEVGVSLVEAMVAAGIVALLMASVIPVLRSTWENERVLGVANELARWLNQVKTYSMRNDSRCDITLDPDNIFPNAVSGQRIATVTAACAPGMGAELGPNFLIPQQPAGRFTFTHNAPGDISYTPRGSTNNLNAVSITIAIQGRPALRCVQISPILGQVRVGVVGANGCEAN